MSIANVMFASGYHQEFCQGFITSRRHALDEYIVILEIEKLSIGDVLKMEWSCLNFEIKKWIRAMKIIVQVYLPSEKRLCKQILGPFGTVYSFCFAEISKTSMFHLLNFGEAIAMGTYTPEKLFRLLDMYEVLSSLAVEVDLLFFEEVSSFIKAEFHKLLTKFGDTVRSTFLTFDNAIATNPSTNKFPGGGVHHLTKYVMNYIMTLCEYGDTLNLLFADESPVHPDIEPDISALTFSPVGRHFQKITATLESNLSNKCRLYKDMALQHIFMMNNIHYIVQKIKSSELSLYFGDAWLRVHTANFQQDARNYERVTWSTALSLLREETGSKASLKTRYTGFIDAFEEVYRTQTGWCVPDVQLREDLQISISQKLVHAYRTFTGKNSANIGDKWIKCNVDDLEHYILDLFEGSPKSLNHHQLKARGLSFRISLP
ncbi:hypothetical protein L6164_011250 [Bauhinia variegata]|nr:hypothetical protein L6164_011250 [Bauhinia variegata]